LENEIGALIKTAGGSRMVRCMAWQKITVYVPEELKRLLARAAATRGCSQSELIREALRAVAARALPPRPRLPRFKSGKPRLAERVDQGLAGFGDS